MPNTNKTVKPIETIEECEDVRKVIATVSGAERDALIAAVEKWETDHGKMPKAIRPIGN